jgi:hypothetical protein
MIQKSKNIVVACLAVKSDVLRVDQLTIVHPASRLRSQETREHARTLSFTEHSWNGVHLAHKWPAGDGYVRLPISSFEQHPLTDTPARDLTLEAAKDVGPRRPTKPLPAQQIKKLLDSRHEREVLDGLRRVIAVRTPASIMPSWEELC